MKSKFKTINGKTIQYVQILHILPKMVKHTIPTIRNFLVVQTEGINGIK